MTHIRYAECDLDAIVAIVAIRDQLPPARGVADVVTASGTVRARVDPGLVTAADLGRAAVPSGSHPFCHYE